MPPKKKEDIDISLLPDMRRVGFKLNINLPNNIIEKYAAEINSLSQYNLKIITREDIISTAIDNKLYYNPDTLTDKQKKDPEAFPSTMTDKIFLESLNTLITENDIDIKKIKYNLENNIEDPKDAKTNNKNNEPNDVDKPTQFLSSDNIIYLYFDDIFITNSEYHELNKYEEYILDYFINVNYNIIKDKSSHNKSSSKLGSKKNLTDNNAVIYSNPNEAFTAEELKEIEAKRKNINIFKDSLTECDTAGRFFNCIFEEFVFDISISELDNNINKYCIDLLIRLENNIKKIDLYNTWKKDVTSNNIYENNFRINDKHIKIYKDVKNNSNNSLSYLSIIDTAISKINEYDNNIKEYGQEKADEIIGNKELSKKINEINDIFENILETETGDAVNNKSVVPGDINIITIDEANNTPVPKKYLQEIQKKNISELIPIYNINQNQLIEKIVINDFNYKLKSDNILYTDLLDNEIINYISNEEYCGYYSKSLFTDDLILRKYNDIDSSLTILLKHQFNNSIINTISSDITWSVFPNRNNWVKYFNNNENNLNKKTFIKDVNCETIGNLSYKNNYIYPNDSSFTNLCQLYLYDGYNINDIRTYFSFSEFGIKCGNKIDPFVLEKEFEKEVEYEVPIENQKKGKPIEYETKTRIEYYKEYDKAETDNTANCEFYYIENNNNFKLLSHYERVFTKEILDNISNYDTKLIDKFGIQSKSEYKLTYSISMNNGQNIVKLLNNGDVYMENKDDNNDELYRIITKKGSIIKFLKDNSATIYLYNGDIAYSTNISNKWININTKGYRWESDLLSDKKIELEELIYSKKSKSATEDFPEIWLRNDNFITIKYEDNSSLNILPDNTKVKFNTNNKIIIEHSNYHTLEIDNNFSGKIFNRNYSNLGNSTSRIYLSDGSVIEQYYYNNNSKIFYIINTGDNNLLYLDNINEICCIPFKNRVEQKVLESKKLISKDKIKQLITLVEQQMLAISEHEKTNKKNKNKLKNNKQKDILNEVLNNLKTQFLKNNKKINHNYNKTYGEIFKLLTDSNTKNYKKIIQNISAINKELLEDSNDIYFNSIINNNSRERVYGIYTYNLDDKALLFKNDFNLLMELKLNGTFSTENIDINKYDNLLNENKSGLNNLEEEKKSLLNSTTQNKSVNLFYDQLHLLFDDCSASELFIFKDNKFKRVINFVTFVDNFYYYNCKNFMFNKSVSDDDENNGFGINLYYSNISDRVILINDKIPDIDLLPELNNNNLDSNSTVINYNFIKNYFIRQSNFNKKEFKNIYKRLKNNDKIYNKEGYQLKIIKINNLIKCLYNRQKDITDISIDNITTECQAYLNNINNRNTTTVTKEITKSFEIETNYTSVTYKKQGENIFEIINKKEKYLKRKEKENKIYEKCGRFVNNYFLTIKGRYFIDNKPKEDPKIIFSNEDIDILNELKKIGEDTIKQQNDIIAQKNRVTIHNKSIPNSNINLKNSIIQNNNTKNSAVIKKADNRSMAKKIEEYEDKLKELEREKIIKSYEIKKKEYDVYGNKRSNLQLVKHLFNCNTKYSPNKKYIETDGEFERKIRIASKARAIKTQGLDPVNIRTHDTYKSVQKLMDKGNTELGIIQNAVKIGLEHDNMQKGLFIYPDNINFGDILSSKCYKINVKILNEDDINHRILIKNNSKSLVKAQFSNDKIVKDKSGRTVVSKLDTNIASGMSRMLIIAVDCSNLETANLNTNIEIMTKYRVYNLDIKGTIVTEQNYNKNKYEIEQEYFDNFEISALNKATELLKKTQFKESTNNESEYIPKVHFDRNINLTTVRNTINN